MVQKTKILTLIVFGLLFLNLSAQDDSFENDPAANIENENRKFRFGLQLNPHISWLKSNTNGFKSEGSKFNFSYGLSTEFFLTQNYLFSTGLFISSLGGEISYQGLYENTSGVHLQSLIQQTYSIKYIEIPLALKLRTNEIGYLTYFGQFGLKPGVKFKSSSDYTYSEINNSPKIEGQNTASDIFFMNLSLIIGAGVEYSISGNTAIMIGITYNNGFINQLSIEEPNKLDAGGKASTDAFGQPIYSEDGPSAILNYVALNIGLYF